MKTTLSPSSINLFLECPRCFWLYVVEGMKRPEKPFPSLPLGMDRILKEHFDLHRKEGRIPKEIDGMNCKLFPDIEKLNVWRDNFRGLRFTDETGAVLMGAIDDLIVAENGLYAPLDFKTRGYQRKDDTHEYYQQQMDSYSFLLERNGMPSAGFAILLFYHPKSVTSSCNVEFHAEPLKIRTNSERGGQVFREAARCASGPEPEKSSKCIFCEWHEKVSSRKTQQKMDNFL